MPDGELGIEPTLISFWAGWSECANNGRRFRIGSSVSSTALNPSHEFVVHTRPTKLQQKALDRSLAIHANIEYLHHQQSCEVDHIPKRLEGQGYCAHVFVRW
jgi:hypothetical protein